MKELRRKQAPLIILMGIWLCISCSSVDSVFEDTREQNTIEAYDRFLSEYQDSRYTIEANQNREKLYYEKVIRDVKSQNSKDVHFRASLYDAYLHTYPSGVFVSETETNREKDWYDTVIFLNSPEGYQSYLTEYPSGQFKEAVEKKHEQISFETVKTENSIQAFDRYLISYPNGKYVDEA